MTVRRLLLPICAAGLLWAGLACTLDGGRSATTAPAAPDPFVYPPSVATVAGGGPVGDGGPADHARLSLPGGVLVAPDGDLIVVDFGNHRVRRVDRNTGEISTLAGTGEPGFSGDGGPSHRAQLARPENAAFSPDGDLYIVDSHNHRIRRIDFDTGIIDTVVGVGTPGFSGDGGPALEGELHQPEGIAFDAAGNYYIGDTLNGRVRRVDAETGVLTTVAGNGEIGVSPDGTPLLDVEFMRLARLTVDADGNVIVADSPSQKVQLLDFEAGTVRTLAGNGREGYSGDGGPATAAEISYPEGVALDPRGHLFFADLGNHSVRRVDKETGVITTVAGCGRKGFSGDGGPALEACMWSPGRLAFGPAGDLYVADIINARIRRIDPRTGVIDTVVGSGELGDGGPAARASLAIPGDLAFDGESLYIAEYGNRRVRRVNLADGTISTVVGGGLLPPDGVPALDAELRLPEGIALDGDGGLLIADSLAHRVWRVDMGEGTIHSFAGDGRPGFAGDGGPAREARLSIPGAVAVGPDGLAYIADYGNGRIRVVDPEGTIRSLEVEGGETCTRAPVVSMTAADRGLFWVISGESALCILHWEDRRIEYRPVVLPGRTPKPGEFQLGDLSVNGDKVVLADTLSHRLLSLDLEGREAVVLAGSGRQGFAGDGGAPLEASFFRPGAVTFGRPGEIFVADTFNHRVRRIPLPSGGHP